MIHRSLLAVLLAPSLLAAQTPSAPASPSARPTPVLQATRAGGAVRIDGRLDDAPWAAAEVAGGFTESYPNAGAPARFNTEARVLYADDALYVAMRMADPRPDSIAAQLARRDAGGL